MATATWIRNELEQRGVFFEELQHPEAFTAQEMAQKEHISGHRAAKVVGVIADGEPLELILPASRRVDLSRLRSLTGAGNLRLASEDEIADLFTDCERGAIPALRHWGNVGVWMDDSLTNAGDIVFQAGTHCDAIRMHFHDWFGMVQPRVGSFTAPLKPENYADMEEDLDEG